MVKKVLNKNENKILLMLAFFSISIGLWNNFRQLWLEDNSFSVSNISNIISLGTLISVIAIAFIGKYVKLNKLKNTLVVVLVLKFINMLFLYIFNKSNLLSVINILIIIDIATEYITITSVYPLITILNKSGTLYSKRRLTEYLFRDIGILFGGVFIGKTISGILIDYNVCLIISNIFLLISIFVITTIKLDTRDEKKENKNSCFKIILKSKIIYLYLIYVLIGTIAMSTALGLKMLVLTNYFGYSDNVATNYLLIIGLLADIFGIVALKYLTPKNDYLTITIKFGIRFIGYILVFISNNLIITIIAISWSIFISTSYENICDGVYINRLDNKYQLSFSNICHIVRFLGESIGVFLCGMMYEIGLRYMFGLSAIFMIFQLGIAYYLINLRKKEELINEWDNKIQRKRIK